MTRRRSEIPSNLQLNAQSKPQTHKMLCASAEDAIPGAGPNTGTADTSVGGRMTSAFGVPVASTDNSLRGGDHGPMLLEDFNFLEKIQQFDRERIPERVVHARGHGMFGFFEPYHVQGGPDISAYSRAAVFKDKLTPVFMRLSNVQGEFRRGLEAFGRGRAHD